MERQNCFGTGLGEDPRALGKGEHLRAVVHPAGEGRQAGRVVDPALGVGNDLAEPGHGALPQRRPTAAQEAERRTEEAGGRLAHLDANQVLDARVREVLERRLASLDELNDAVFEVGERIGEQLLRLAGYIGGAVEIIFQGC
ncbi:hypothetical protein D3C79_806320 [compost metagenome]